MAFIAWVVYAAAYLGIARSTAGWQDPRKSRLDQRGRLRGRAVPDLFFVNLVTVGLHSAAVCGVG